MYDEYLKIRNKQNIKYIIVTSNVAVYYRDKYNVTIMSIMIYFIYAQP